MPLTVPVSIAGLWSARAATNHFEDVLIVEPEAWVGLEDGTSDSYDAHGDCVLEEAPPRTRVMQYTNTVHGECRTISRKDKYRITCY